MIHPIQKKFPEPGILLPAPVDLGAPAKFDHWRTGQETAILDALNSEKRFVFSGQPTGAGKSICAVCFSLMHGGRVCYLTENKGLQARIHEECEEIGMATVWGQNNYTCLALADEGMAYTTGLDCGNGPCHSGVKCLLRERGCLYYDAVRKASQAPMVVTNYSFWMFQQKFGKGLGNIDVLICDEAHLATDALSSFLSVKIDDADLERQGLHAPLTEDVEKWRDFCDYAEKVLTNRLTDVKVQIQSAGADVTKELLRQSKRLRTLLEPLGAVARARGDWVAERVEKTTKFDPVTPAAYAEQYLFAGVKKVLLMSATVRPKEADLLGLSTDDYDFFEYPSQFDVKRRPIYILSTGVRLRYDVERATMAQWVRYFDKFAMRRLGDRKGVFHTVSYKLRDYARHGSEYGRFMITHDRHNTRDKVKEFQEADPPAILLSPSVGTGFDFIGDQARFNYIGKVPFRQGQEKIQQARRERDPEYDLHKTAQTLAQMAGRINRSEDDWGETAIGDDQSHWFLSNRGKCRETGTPYRNFFPNSFWEARVWCDSIPDPLALED